MADIVQLPPIPAAEDPLAMLLDLRRRLDVGEDIGSRVVHIRQAVAATRAYAGGLRRVLVAPDDRQEAEAGLMAVGEKVLVLAERNVAACEELLRLIETSVPRTSDDILGEIPDVLTKASDDPFRR